MDPFTAPAHSVPPGWSRKPRWLRALLLTALTLLLIAACGYAGYRISAQFGIQTLAEDGQRQLELNARAVESEISRYTYLPSLLELESSVGRLLQSPTPFRREQVNAYLEGLNQRSGSLAIYVLDVQGRVVATSNWREPSSYLGEDLAFRAYYQDAMAGRLGRFYGIGSTTGEPGYYLAHGLKKAGQIIGVAVVKVRLNSLEQRWQRAHLEAFVTDENGIIILSTNPARRLKATRPLDAETRERLARSLQYHWWALEELQPLAREQLGADIEQVSFASDGKPAPSAKPVTYLAQTRPLADTTWHLTLMTPLQDLRRSALSHAMLASAAFALLLFVGLALNQRRKVLATRLAAREALQRANNELERKITERTADLRASNQRLLAEVREREQAETTLRQAQDELVQSGKLAVIGQMSTAIAHELNQPLAALRTLSANTVRFLQRGSLDVASSNLQSIAELVDRMGKITGSLRAFARRNDDQAEADLGQAIDAALQLLQHHRSCPGLQLHRDYPLAPAKVRVAIEQTRLEQILINLIANALDAMAAQSDRQLWLQGRSEAGSYQLTVRDNGSGIAAEVRGHLFEPFFTTKPGEQGLGLGLTLSASLAASAGGSLSVEHPPSGGSAFILSLRLAPEPQEPSSHE
ncbi:ATP-binding protein [Pseudomonas sp. 5P_3.1_Bac2]|uniref:sensor histidine kinase n=1 Tax=Pseudomonas sp. 5P_3.1_Bac2 TaxID=2971617 RepID=UPI0021C78B82|nr:ATP-binding protein [Pseudomonas sp. 5P_3.1_Bac2]MCU1719005.1 ATP-binding protein [Pseudomonas sp. 5P_3.1_Bac2]